MGMQWRETCNVGSCCISLRVPLVLHQESLQYLKFENENARSFQSSHICESSDPKEHPEIILYAVDNYSHNDYDM